jgi:hypothetical protein
MRDFFVQRLINVGVQLDWLVVEAGRILSRYMQPDSISKDDNDQRIGHGSVGN